MRLLSSLLLLIAVADPTPLQAKPHVLKPARFFYDGQQNSILLRAIRRATEPLTTFNWHFSLAYVSCGPGCDSYWFVDRETGGVVEVPQSPAEELMIYKVEACLNIEIVRVTYGNRDGVSGPAARSIFRLRKTKFVVEDDSKWPEVANLKTPEGNYCFAILDDGPIF